MGGCELDASGSGTGPAVCFCEHGNEPSASIQCKNFLTERVLVSQRGLCSMKLVK